MKRKIDVDCFLRAQDGAFYIVGMHLLLDKGSKCVHAGGDCVGIWKMIILFLKLTPSALGVCSKKSKSTI